MLHQRVVNAVLLHVDILHRLLGLAVLEVHLLLRLQPLDHAPHRIGLVVVPEESLNGVCDKGVLVSTAQEKYLQKSRGAGALCGVFDQARADEVDELGGP